jgi:hypothetical protein
MRATLRGAHRCQSTNGADRAAPFALACLSLNDPSLR